MEKKRSTSEKFNHNLGDLPTKSQVKVDKPRNGPLEKVVKPDPEEEMKLIEFDEATKKAASADGIQIEKNTSIISRDSEISGDKACQSDANIQDLGVPRMKSSKSLLYEICAANRWDPPVFDCCKEEGPNHLKLFTFKVTVEIAEPSLTVLECFGAPKSKKKTAAEHSAEGALWYLGNLGYHSKHK